MSIPVRAALAVFLMALPVAVPAAMKPAALDAVQHMPAELTILRPDGSEARYTQSDLETLPTYSLTTITPWRAEPARFEGVRLFDLLEANGLHEVEMIRVTAENDYSALIPRAVWQDVGILVATRADGEPLTRRVRGPIQFVIDHDAYVASEAATEEHLVWMAKRIEVER